ncbi:MAG: rhomboid family intramembrane serine protease [Pseudomonadales bacterium]|nr:rhomboid family intramembrane serine protease [Pseudomonadales bacterium]
MSHHPHRRPAAGGHKGAGDRQEGGAQALETPWISVARGGRADQLQLVRLALEAQGIAYGIARDEHGWRVVVPPERAHVAQREAQAVLGEGLPQRRILPRPQGDRGWGAALLVVALLWLLPGLAGLGLAPLAVTDWGVGDAAALRDGALWRILTPLLLHGDVPHLLGNSLMAVLMACTLGPWLGSAYAWTLVVLAAGLANGVNLMLAGDGFRSLGASTALFAAFGVFGVGRLQQGAPHRPDGLLEALRWAAPLGAGLVWLLLFGLGGGDERVDVGAHLWGFAAGMLLTLLNPLRPAPAGPWARWALAPIPLGLLAGAWLWAVLAA